MLITTGTVLLLAVSTPLPFLNVKLLGLIMIAAGLVKARAPRQVSSWLRRRRRKVTAAGVPHDALLEASAPVPARPSAPGLECGAGGGPAHGADGGLADPSGKAATAGQGPINRQAVGSRSSLSSLPITADHPPAGPRRS